jgi:hypothetical protein
MEAERDAADKVRAALALPVPESADDCGTEGFFDPWEIFPCFYGSYSGAFDQLALEVLRRVRDRRFGPEELSHEMFREYLCRHNLCDYGTSPKGCFPTLAFDPLLPELIEKWAAYSLVFWGEDVTAG